MNQIITFEVNGALLSLKDKSVTLEVIRDEEVYSSKTISVGAYVQSWIVSDYPSGEVTFRISSADEKWEKRVFVQETEIKFEYTKDSLVFDFDPTGRSNEEENAKIWKSESGDAQFSDIDFFENDGWLSDENGCDIFRILPGGQMTIPFEMFKTDKRSSGFTVEIEMSTHNNRNSDSSVLSCFYSNRGINILSQKAVLKSEQSEISMQFKENSKVRLSFCVEPKTLKRMVYVYVDAIMCGAVRYSESDNFAQALPVGITIGAKDCGIDIYRISVYEKNLSSNEILDNFICTRETLSKKLETYKNNDIFSNSFQIVPSKLPKNLPYMIITAKDLPSFKGDEKSCDITFVNPNEPSKSFQAQNVSIDVQGTSSAGYKVKNYKIKLENGLQYSSSMKTAEKFALSQNAVETDTFCLKADVASSEGANNVELAKLYEETVPYKTQAQKNDSRIRQGIDGFPIVLFKKEEQSADVVFLGKYNFNNDKSTEEVFGLRSGFESWEIKNNTSDRALFKKSDYSASWTDDFEARYPKNNSDYSLLKTMTDWLSSTNRDNVSSKSEKEACLLKFKNEFENYFAKDAWIFYYVFTETFLMVDSRAKNLFPSYVDGKWIPLPYDFDTALGINNEGQLVFDYNLEDTDEYENMPVFNGSQSVLWCNLKDAFKDEISQMYALLRKGELFNFEAIDERFSSHQQLWPQAVWNEDAYVKYLEPLYTDNDASYLTMLQGSKESQRKAWLSNRFKYMDSKYQTALSNEKYITLRCYSPGDITLTLYNHVYPRIKYGSYTVSSRGEKNQTLTLENPLDTMNDTEVYIYSSDCISDIGDLSPLQVGYANFSMAAKLRKLKIGDSSKDYMNEKLKELYVGNNELLEEIDVQNCTNLSGNIDLSGCVCLRTVKAFGSSVSSFTFAKGAKIKTLEIPNTISNLTVVDCAQLEIVKSQGFENVSTLRVENTRNVPIEEIISNSSKLERVRLSSCTWYASDEEKLKECFDKLKNCKGIDSFGSNTEMAFVSGKVYVPSISPELLEEISDAFPLLTVVADGKALYVVRYLDEDGTLLYKCTAKEGEKAADIVANGTIEAPTKEETQDTKYVFDSFGELCENIQSAQTYIAKYKQFFAVRFYNESQLLCSLWIEKGHTSEDPIAEELISVPTKESTAEYSYTFSSWDKALENIVAPCDFYALFKGEKRTYTVYFYNGKTLLQTFENVPYGESAAYTGETPKKTDVENPDEYVFKCWSVEPENIIADTYCYALYRYAGFLEDSWETIISRVKDGTYKTYYDVGALKEIELTYSDETKETATVEIVGIDHDDLADGSGKAALSFLCKKTISKVCPFQTINETNEGGWEQSSLRQFCSQELYPSIEETVREQIKPVFKISDGGTQNPINVTTTDTVWIPSATELGMRWNTIGTQGEKYAIFSGWDSESAKDRICDIVCDDNKSLGYATRSSNDRVKDRYNMVAYESGYILPREVNVNALIRFGFCLS